MKTDTPRTDHRWNIDGDDNGIAAWQWAQSLERENLKLRDHAADLTRLLRASAKGNQWPSPLEIDAAINKSQDISANAQDHGHLPAKEGHE